MRSTKIREKLYSRQGFTLIEILIVIGITALLSGLIITYTSTGRDQVALQIETAKTAQTVLKAKSLALATYNRPNLPCGYGVRFDYVNQNYTLFGYNAPSCATITRLDSAHIEEITVNDLTPSLELLRTAPDSIRDILFLPPDPKTFIWREGSVSTSTSARIYLGAKSGASGQTINVSSGGQISF